MATLLYRLGHFALRNRKAMLAAWLLALLLFAAGALGLKGAFSSSFSIPGLASQAALEELQAQVPAAGGTNGRIVVAAPDGHTLSEPAYQQAIGAIVTESASLEAVISVLPPVPQRSVSADDRIGYIQIAFGGEISEIPPATQARLAAIADEQAAATGLRIELGGAAVSVAPAIGSTEGIGVAVALVVLLLTFGSVVAAGLPMLTALIGIGIGVSGILIVSGYVQMSNTAPILALMLGLAVGIDYALFVVSKHRDQLRRGMDLEESIARANGTAGTAVVFAGLTVVIALIGLTVVGIPFLAVMGIGSAFTVAVAVLIAITLVPALLGFAGMKVLPAKQRAAAAAAGRIDGAGTDVNTVHTHGAHTDGAHTASGHTDPDPHRTGARWITMVTRHPIAAALLGVLLLGVLSIPALQLRLGLPTDASAGPDTTKRQAYDLVVQGFGAGANNPLIVTVKPDQPLQLEPAVAAQVDQQVSGQFAILATMNPGLAKLLGPDALPQAIGQAHAAALMQPVVQQLAVLPNVASAAAVAGTADGRFFAIQVVPKTGADAPATEQLVQDLRAAATQIGAQQSAVVQVTGLNVVQMDVSDKLAAALPIYLAIVVGLALIILLLVFRSLVVPLKAGLGFLLSIAAAFGAVVAVYQLGWLQSLFGVDSPAPIISFLPILLIGILFGLSMDYEMFVVSGMKEAHAHGLPARAAVRQGYLAGSRVVIAAAIIMASVFAGFILAPDAIIASIGFSLAVGVLADAFLVRLLIVPAVMWLLGEAAWYLPRWLDRWLPRVDIEGTALIDQLDARDAAARAAGPTT